MGDIEGTAKPIVGPMAQGIPTTLDAAAQRAVANWAVLKGLVAALVSETQQPIPDRHYRRVCAAKGAPANTVRVWIGMRQNLAHPTKPGRAKLFDSHFMPVTNAARKGPVPADLERYISEGGVFNGTIFSVGHFFALVLQQTGPGCSSARRRDRTRSRPSFRSGRSEMTSSGHRPCPSTCSATPTTSRSSSRWRRRWSPWSVRKSPSRRQGAPVPLFTVCHCGAREGMSDHEHVPAASRGGQLRTGRTKASRHISTSRLSRRSHARQANYGIWRCEDGLLSLAHGHTVTAQRTFPVMRLNPQPSRELAPDRASWRSGTHGCRHSAHPVRQRPHERGLLRPGLARPAELLRGT
jgi:hypothetical protein